MLPGGKYLGSVEVQAIAEHKDLALTVRQQPQGVRQIDVVVAGGSGVGRP